VQGVLSLEYQRSPARAPASEGDAWTALDPVRSQGPSPPAHGVRGDAAVTATVSGPYRAESPRSRVSPSGKRRPFQSAPLTAGRAALGERVQRTGDTGGTRASHVGWTRDGTDGMVRETTADTPCETARGDDMRYVSDTKCAVGGKPCA